MNGSRALREGNPSNVLILLTEEILAMTYDHSWAFVSAVMIHPLQDIQGCPGGNLSWGRGRICKMPDSLGNQNQLCKQESVHGIFETLI